MFSECDILQFLKKNLLSPWVVFLERPFQSKRCTMSGNQKKINHFHGAARNNLKLQGKIPTSGSLSAAFLTQVKTRVHF